MNDITIFNHLGNNIRVTTEYAAAALRDRLAYVEGLGWLTYTPDRGVWEVVHESAALNAVADVILAWYRGAVLTGDADRWPRGGPAWLAFPYRR